MRQIREYEWIKKKQKEGKWGKGESNCEKDKTGIMVWKREFSREKITFIVLLYCIYS